MSSDRDVQEYIRLLTPRAEQLDLTVESMPDAVQVTQRLPNSVSGERNGEQLPWTVTYRVDLPGDGTYAITTRNHRERWEINVEGPPARTTRTTLGTEISRGRSWTFGRDESGDVESTTTSWDTGEITAELEAVAREIGLTRRETASHRVGLIAAVAALVLVAIVLVALMVWAF